MRLVACGNSLVVNKWFEILAIRFDGLLFLLISCKRVAIGNRLDQSMQGLYWRPVHGLVFAYSTTILYSTPLIRMSCRPVNVLLMLNDMQPTIWRIDPPAWAKLTNCRMCEDEWAKRQSVYYLRYRNESTFHYSLQYHRRMALRVWYWICLVANWLRVWPRSHADWLQRPVVRYCDNHRVFCTTANVNLCTWTNSVCSPSMWISSAYTMTETERSINLYIFKCRDGVFDLLQKSQIILQFRNFGDDIGPSFRSFQCDL